MTGKGLDRLLCVSLPDADLVLPVRASRQRYDNVIRSRREHERYRPEAGSYHSSQFSRCGVDDSHRIRLPARSQQVPARAENCSAKKSPRSLDLPLRGKIPKERGPGGARQNYLLTIRAEIRTGKAFETPNLFSCDNIQENDRRLIVQRRF